MSQVSICLINSSSDSDSTASVENDCFKTGNRETFVLFTEKHKNNKGFVFFFFNK